MLPADTADWEAKVASDDGKRREAESLGIRIVRSVAEHALDGSTIRS